MVRPVFALLVTPEGTSDGGAPLDGPISKMPPNAEKWLAIAVVALVLTGMIVVGLTMEDEPSSNRARNLPAATTPSENHVDYWLINMMGQPVRINLIHLQLDGATPYDALNTTLAPSTTKAAIITCTEGMDRPILEVHGWTVRWNQNCDNSPVNIAIYSDQVCITPAVEGGKEDCVSP